MNGFWKPGLLAALSLGAVSLAIALPGSAKVEKGQAAPDFSGMSLDGKRVTLSDFRGKNPVLLNFMADFAPPCRRQYAHLKGVDEKLGPRGLKVIAISQDETRDVASALPKQQGVRFPVVFDPKALIAEKYDVQVLPHTVVVGRDGNVQAVIIGGDLAELDRAVGQVMK